MIYKTLKKKIQTNCDHITSSEKQFIHIFVNLKQNLKGSNETSI